MLCVSLCAGALAGGAGRPHGGGRGRLDGDGGGGRVVVWRAGVHVPRRPALVSHHRPTAAADAVLRDQSLTVQAAPSSNSSPHRRQMRAIATDGVACDKTSVTIPLIIGDFELPHKNIKNSKGKT